jgi:hypothetical protein
MAKVSVGLRGWRFEESEIFTEDGEYKPLDEIPEEPRRRLVRLPILLDRPCDACYLVFGDEEIRKCREPTVVYGEPLNEVVLCDRHEVDFLYWFREAGGKEFRGEEEFRDAFYEWFDDGERAPEGYAGMEHVDTDPEGLPDLPDQREVQRRLEERHAAAKRDRAAESESDADADTALDEIDAGGNVDADVDADDDEDGGDEFDLGMDYPKK